MGRRYGILTDIHANLEALTTALETLEAEKVDQIVCLGDIIGYNASPGECLKLIQERATVSLKGNHERYLVGEVPQGVRQATLDVINWTRSALTEEQIGWVRELPDQAIHDDLLLLVHGSPRDKDEYLLTPEAIKASILKLGTDYVGIPLCLFGHSHIPMVVGGGKVDTDFKDTRKVDLDRQKTYLVNVGSVGQPRDNCPKCAFGIFDTDEWSVTVFRKDYDLVRAQQRILEAGLDRRLAIRLGHGK